jgi:hypothetical protein
MGLTNPGGFCGSSDSERDSGSPAIQLPICGSVVTRGATPNVSGGLSPDKRYRPAHEHPYGDGLPVPAYFGRDALGLEPVIHEEEDGVLVLSAFYSNGPTRGAVSHMTPPLGVPFTLAFSVCHRVRELTTTDLTCLYDVHVNIKTKSYATRPPFRLSDVLPVLLQVTVSRPVGGILSSARGRTGGHPSERSTWGHRPGRPSHA